MTQQSKIGNSDNCKTAVDWLIEQLINLDKQLDGRRKSDDSTVIKINPTKIYEQAKAMEKERIMKAFSDGQELSINNPLLPHYSSKEYYNDNYNK